ncbi:hypothetical protein GW937_02530 [Candidatus Kaiserbacteria bacterium]|nr:hypothetical protein [Candidatus Kaiserbacteria bacterium]
MKNVYFFIFSAMFLLIAGVQSTEAVGNVVGNGLIDGESSAGGLGGLTTAIIGFSKTYLLPLILAIGFIVFVWGMFLYFILGGADDEKKTKGKSLVIYAIAGFVLILSFWGIVNLIAGGIGGTGDTIELPKVPGSSNND